MHQAEIVEELSRRAQRYLGERRLVVDYYRIRRRVAFPWPVPEMPEVKMAVAFENYVWDIWLSWEAEERISALGWAGELTGDKELQARCREEVLSVAKWPYHSRGVIPDLPLGHFLRTLLVAKRNWAWLGEEVGREIDEASRRALEQKRGWMAENLGKILTKDEILTAKDRNWVVRNIPLIGTTVLAMAASDIGDSATVALINRVLTFITVRLDLLEGGATEDVAYDGYVLDFIADLLPVLPVKQRQALLAHPGLAGTLRMGIDLAAPGDVLNVANLADVEPREMTFHACAHAKLAKMMPAGESIWYLGHARLDWLRADGLGALYYLEGSATAPAAEPVAGPYAVALRTGWDEDDTAVAIGVPREDIGHLHFDGGSIMIARGGVWLLADPGYQQYLDTKERDFTLGLHAHNAPIVNGHGQSVRANKVVALEKGANGVQHAVLDLTASYPAEAKVAAVQRAAWLLPSGTVVACDALEGANKVQYSWHGLPDASWWAGEGRAVVYHEGAELWIASSEAKIAQGNLQRLRGSRGHQTLVTETPCDIRRGIMWWVFNVGPKAAEWKVQGEEMMVEKFVLRAPR